MDSEITIIVLGGGNSTEREISLRSAASVTKALRSNGFQVIEHDPKDGLSFLDNLPDRSIVFPILHGAGGEDGTIQAELENRGIAYLGTQSTQSHICFDKALTRKALESAGIPVAKGMEVDKRSYWSNELITKPHVLKVTHGGSSIGTYIVKDPVNVDKQQINKLFELDKSAVIEELVEGIEITVPVLDMKALPVIEIRPPDGGEFDYENKYNGKTKELCPPQSVSDDQQLKAQKLAEEVHESLGARHLSRTDIIITNDKMVVLELNTMPGMTEQSLFPLSAKVAGLNMEVLVSKFVDLVKRDYKIN